jgi:cytochrome c oxidase cbb3-type subunit 3
MRPQQRPHHPRAGKSFNERESRQVRPAQRTLRSGLSRLCAGCVLLMNLQLQVAQSRTQGTSQPVPKGQATFSSVCASCHGLDGRGSERAPNIAQKPEVQRLSDEALARIIAEGVPGTGMPAFRSLPTPDAKAVVAYLRILQGATKATFLRGNPERGKEVFFGKGRCSECHMVAGNGGFIASDLSDYARTHSVEEVRSAITEPAPLLEGRAVLATTRDGQKYAGRLRNEDNFSVQLQTLDGAFHFLSKTDLARLEPDSRILMPSDYGSTLSAAELDDLVSYLLSSQETNTSEPAKENEE